MTAVAKAPFTLANTWLDYLNAEPPEWICAAEELFRQILQATDEAIRDELMIKLWKLYYEDLWTVDIVKQVPKIIVCTTCPQWSQTFGHCGLLQTLIFPNLSDAYGSVGVAMTLIGNIQYDYFRSNAAGGDGNYIQRTLRYCAVNTSFFRHSLDRFTI